MNALIINYRKHPYLAFELFRILCNYEITKIKEVESSLEDLFQIKIADK